MLSQEVVEQLIKIVQEEVEIAIQEGNSPFASVLVDSEGTIIAKARNQQNTQVDPTAHSEILLLRESAKILHTRNLKGYVVIVNAEPCSMCMSAIVKAHIEKVYYGAPQEETNNPDIRAEYIKSKTSTPLSLYSGYLADLCKDQIRRGRTKIDGVSKEFHE